MDANYATTESSAIAAERLKEKAPETEAGRRTGVAPFQGDIILSDSTVTALVSGTLPEEVIERRMRRAVKDERTRWPNATVPYKFSSNFREFQLCIILSFGIKQ